jgi:hypothetical protein
MDLNASPVRSQSAHILLHARGDEPEEIEAELSQEVFVTSGLFPTHPIPSLISAPHFEGNVVRLKENE